MAQNQLIARFNANHAFLIAVQDYGQVAPLKTPVNDVQSLADVLRLEVHGFRVHEPLLNPTKQALETFLEKTLPSLVRSGDRVLLYFAGHGIAFDEADQVAPKGYFLPADARKNDEASFVSMDFINQAIQKLGCRHLLLVLDCCFAGSFQWAAKPTRSAGRRLSKTIFRQRFDYFLQQPAWQVIASAAYHQQALDVAHSHALGQRESDTNSRNSEHSPFAGALIRALRDGAGDQSPADGLMTISEIFAYLQDQLVQFSHIHTQKPAFFPLLPNHRQGEFVFLNPKKKLHLSDYDDSYNPYRGLQAYESEHQGAFYGRERVVEDMLEKLKNGPILIVSGDSGAGKSSAVKAGLLPKMEKQGYRSVIIRPGAHPLEALDTAIKEAVALKDTVLRILLVDQLEELTTQYATETDREAFLFALAAQLRGQDVFQKIVLTVRSDFETLFEQSPLAPWWRDARYNIPGFSYEELQEIVWQPIQERCIEYEEGLGEELIGEVQNRIGGLPLLSFTLSELYERFKARRVGEDSHRVITWEDYRVTGGVVGALQNSADEAYNNLHDNAQRASLRHLMLRLISLSGGETAGRRVTHEELDFDDPVENERIALVRDQWIEKRLLRSGSDNQNKPFIEPAHDALVRSWRRIQDWIQEYRGENILLHAKLGAAVAEYHKRNEGKGYLWDSNPGLEQVATMQKKDALLPNSAESVFLDRSWRLKRQKRNIRNGWIIAAFVVLAGLAIWALANRNDALTANKDLRSKVKEAALSNFEREKTNNRIPEAIKVLQTAVEQLKPEPTPDLNSLINMWRPLGDSLVRADSLVKINRLKEAQITLLNSRKLVPGDVFLLQKIQEIDTNRKALCRDLKTKGQGFMLYGEPDTAITRFRWFMELDMENDQQVREWRQKCEDEINSKTKKYRQQ